MTKWTDIPGWEGTYSVSCTGEIRNSRGRVIRPIIDRYGYARVRLERDGRKKNERVHRIVCAAFHGPPPTPESHASHVDGDLRNNSEQNLKWETARENINRKRDHGTLVKGSRHHLSRLTDGDVVAIRNRRASGEPYKSIAASYGYSWEGIRAITRRINWK